MVKPVLAVSTLFFLEGCASSAESEYVIDPNFRIDFPQEEIAIGGPDGLDYFRMRVIDGDRYLFTVSDLELEACDVAMSSQLLLTLDFRRKYYCECDFEIQSGQAYAECVRLTKEFESKAVWLMNESNARVYHDTVTVFFSRIASAYSTKSLPIWTRGTLNDEKACSTHIQAAKIPIVTFQNSTGTIQDAWDCMEPIDFDGLFDELLERQ